jgi:hypothetical protein
MNDDKQDLPYIPHISGVSDVEGNTISIELRPTAETYRLIFPDTNANGYLANDGAGTLSWLASSSVGSTVQGMVYSNVGSDVAYSLTLNTPLIFDATSTLTTNSSSFDMPSNGILRYTGAVAKYSTIMATVNLHSISGNREVRVHLYKNSTSIYYTFIHLNTNEYNSCSFSFLVELHQNDMIKLMLESLDGSYSVHAHSYGITGIL